MSDLDAIHDLIGRYGRCLDAADWDGLGRLFERGRLSDEAGNVIAAGSEAVAAFFRDGTRTYDGSPRTTHVVSNTTVADRTDRRIVAGSVFVVFQALDDFPLQAIITGRYTDTFERDGEAWRFAERRFAVDLRGDLSRHLTYDLSGGGGI